MEHVLELWSFAVILLSAFVIGWAAETAQTFLPRAIALSVLAWLQTLPEFAVEAHIAWSQNRDLMIANLTGSLRLLVGLGLPGILFIYRYCEKRRSGIAPKEVVLHHGESLGVVSLFAAILYAVIILAKGSLTCVDSIFLVAIYFTYLGLSLRDPVEHEEDDELPWIGRKLVVWKQPWISIGVIALFILGGIGLQVSVHPFVETLQRWALAAGISTFVFIQWVAPFLSEFPEKATAFNWARQPKKVSLGVMNMVNSNFNQWTMLAAMIPIVFSISLGRFEPVILEGMHQKELALTIAQSFLAGLLLLDLKLSVKEAAGIFVLFFVQFIIPSSHDTITWLYVAWIAVEVAKLGRAYMQHRRLPAAIASLIRREAV